MSSQIKRKKISFLASTIMSRHCCWYVMKHSTYTTIQFARQKVLIVMLMWIVLYFFCWSTRFSVWQYKQYKENSNGHFNCTFLFNVCWQLFVCHFSAECMGTQIHLCHAEYTKKYTNKMSRHSKLCLIFGNQTDQTYFIQEYLFTEIIYVFILPQRDVNVQSTNKINFKKLTPKW